ncbi:MAG: GNAT family N-acetyltransferase [Pseudomonadota bacterium]
MRLPRWREKEPPRESYIIRSARPRDMAGIDAVLSRSYPRLLKADYPPSVLVTAVPVISRAQPDLVASGTYYVAEGEDGALLGAGGWTIRAPGPGRRGADTGHIRHFATDPDHLRKGIAGALMRRVFLDAEALGVARMECLSTRTAVPFYLAQGFRTLGDVEVQLRGGIAFPAIQMMRPMP